MTERVEKIAVFQSLAMMLGTWLMSQSRKSLGLECKTAIVNGQKLAYYTRQGNGRPILLIHGFSAEKDNWLPFARYLPEDRPLLIPDLPGHGDSDYSIITKYTAKTISKTLLVWLEDIGCVNCDVVGNSLGGWISILMAHAQPKLVNSLGLIDAAGVYPPQPSELQQRLEHGENPMLVSNAEEYEVFMDFVYYKRPILPWPIPVYLKAKYLARVEQNHKIWHDMYEHLQTIENLLPEIRQPTLVIWGDRDRVLDPSSVDVFKSLLPDVTTVVIKDCGHSPMVEKAEMTAEKYDKLLLNQRNCQE